MSHPVEHKVTDHNQINSCLATKDGQHMSRHALPEVDKEVLHLQGEALSGNL